MSSPAICRKRIAIFGSAARVAACNVEINFTPRREPLASYAAMQMAMRRDRYGTVAVITRPVLCVNSL